MTRTLMIIASLASMPAVAFAQASPFGFEADAERRMVEELSTRPPRRVQQVGTTSITLRLDLGGGLAGAYRPRSRSHPRGYLAEIAAYRVALALGMDNVPPVVGRAISRPALQTRFDGDAPEAWGEIDADIIWDREGYGLARGAVVYWVPGMRTSDLHTVGALTRATPWLEVGGELPSNEAERARDLSTMLAFDYLIGNWDRWSGGNVSQNEQGTRLIVRDHNVAFLSPLSDTRYARTRSALERVQRFSRAFVTALVRLDEAALGAALRVDPEAADTSILSDDQIADFLARRRALLSYIGALIALHGEERVLAWR